MLLQDLKKISTFFFDIDGVLTNGEVHTSESGELLRTFNIKDGYALQLAVKKGYRICLISGGRGQAIQQRFEALGIPDIFLGVSNKTIVLQAYLDKHQLCKEETLYMGDDIPDLQVMQMVGIATCPADACEEIKAISAYISPFKGGKTAVRDIIEKVLKLQGKWFDANPSAADASL